MITKEERKLIREELAEIEAQGCTCRSCQVILILCREHHPLCTLTRIGHGLDTFKRARYEGLFVRDRYGSWRHYRKDHGGKELRFITILEREYQKLLEDES